MSEETPWLPSPEALAKQAERVPRQMNALMMRAQALRTRVEQLERDIAAGSNPGFARVRLDAASSELRDIYRRLSLAQLILVHPDDAEYAAALRLRRDVYDEARDDSPFRSQRPVAA